ncbi:MAG: tetratricopeptide repeat protein [Candidatus Heimdallarchaeota archaeon]|nr:tetratricopeptide repeat protein [Candidatus Heimdallarchaeota archaeon]
MGNEDISVFEIEKIESEMRIIIDKIKKNENKINKSIKFMIQDIYYDFLISQVPDKKLLSDFYYIVGMGYQLLSGEENKRNVLEFLQQAESVVDESSNFDRLYEIYNEMGIAYYMIKNYDLAYLSYKKAYQLGIDHKMKNNKISAILVNLSNLNTQKGEYKFAISKLNEALNLIEDKSIQKFEDETLRFLGSVHHNLAINFVQLFEYEKSLEHYVLGIKYIKNPDNFRAKLVERIQFILKDIEDESEIISLKDLIIKINQIV